MGIEAELERYKKLLEEERHNFKVIFETNLALGTLDLDKILNKVLKIIITETMADRGCLMLLGDNDKIDVKVNHKIEDFKKELAENPALNKIIREVLRTGENSCVLDTTIDYRFKDLVTEGGQNIYSMICVPLKSKSEILGAVYVDKHKKSQNDEMDFGSRKIELIEAMASQAGVAIEKASLYERLNEAHEELVSLDKLKSKFITLASHELRTPLTIIRGFMYILKREITDKIEERNRQMFFKIESNYNKLEKIVNDISNLARLSSDRIKIEKDWKFLQGIVHSVVDDIKPFIKKRNQSLIVDIPSDLPRIYVNSEQIHMAMLNLLQNAIKFTKDAGTITIVAENNLPKHITVHIRDTGIGIPTDEYENIFQRFYEIQDETHHTSSGDELSFRSGGIGLGLALTKNIIETHDGNVWVESELGKGSDFTFTLPKEIP